jgi:hypothetical protein
MQANINNMLGSPETSEEQNPLAKLKEASEEVKDKPKVSESAIKELDEETLRHLMMSGDNSEGLFVPEEKEDKDNPKHEEVHEDAKITQGKTSTLKGKYAKRFKEDISKNPEKYKVQTPRGEMTIAEAMKQGYNPITKRFEKDKAPEEIKKKHMDGLNDADKAKLEELTNPAAAQIAPKDAEAMGVAPDSPMVQGAMPPQTPEAAPAGIEGLLGGM